MWKPAPRRQEKAPDLSSHDPAADSAAEADSAPEAQVPPAAAEDDVEELDILQFDCAIYYVEEEQEELKVDIIRLGRMKGTCSVHYQTEDASAKAGIRYEAVSGDLHFNDGEVFKTICVPIINGDDWNTTLEFLIRLTDPVNSELGRYLFVSRVKVIDNDYFPTNRFAREIQEFGPGNLVKNGVLDVEILFEYFKLNYSFGGIAWKTWATLGIDIMGNLYYLLTINLVKYLADDVLGPNPGNPLLIPGDQKLTLLAVGGLYLVPYGIINLLDLWKAQLKLAERSRTGLQENIFRKFMNYSEESRATVQGSEMGLIMVSDVNDLVENGYMKMLEIAKSLGRFGVSSYFILVENPDALGPLVISAGGILAFVLVNYRKNVKITEEVSQQQAGVMDLVIESSQKYRLIADYYMRPQVQEVLQKRLTKLNAATVPSKVTDVNNSYFPGWISTVLVAAYIFGGGSDVITGGIQIGAFLASINAVKDAGESFKDIFTSLLDVGKAIGPIQKVTELLNLPTSLIVSKSICNELRGMTKHERRPERLAELRLMSGLRFGTDAIQIQLRNVTFRYADSPDPVIKNANLSVPQGVCVAVVGSLRGGKSTLMKLLGQVLAPTEGVFFVPSYLRILHVDAIPMNMSGSLWSNFAVGKVYWRDNEAEAGRILRICRRLGFSTRLLDMLEGTMEQYLAGDESIETSRWQRRLSASDRSLITVARALIYNPEVLVMNRPTSQLSEITAGKVYELLKEFVRNRGVELPVEGVAKRRPRTAFISFVRMTGVAIADIVWSVEDGSVTELDKEGVSHIQVV